MTDYHRALAAAIQGFWLNANNWLDRNHCTAADGGFGCPQIGLQFLARIGLVTQGGPGKPSESGEAAHSNLAGGSRVLPVQPEDFVRLALDYSITKIAVVLAHIKEALGKLAASLEEPA